jgi:hypothetical protein
MQILIGLLLAGVIVAALLRPRYDFSIRFSKGRITLKGRIPKSKHAEINEFFDRDFQGKATFSLYGRKSASGQLNLRIRGKLTPGEQQQIRNYLIVLL